VSALVLRWLPLPLLLAGLLAAWGLARGRPVAEPSAPPPPAPRVAVVTARPVLHVPHIRTHGSVEPRTEIDLVAEVPGRVASASPALAAGGFFEAGQVLLELDRRDAALALERAEAQVMRSESELGLARARRKRFQSLAESEIASTAQFEEAEHAFQIARAALRDARAVRDQARHDLERTRIRAPFDGRVRTGHVGMGQFVSRGTPLARIYAVDYVEVRLPVASDELAYLDLPLDGSALAEGGPRVTLRADFAGRRAEWPARITRVEGEIAPRSRMLHLVARVDDPYGRRHPGRAPLTAGLFVEAEIEGAPLEGVVLLPRAALRASGELLIVDGNDVVRARRVEVARADGDRVAVSAGLAAGERVVASALGVVPGARVEPEALALAERSP
jgi:RND family efflux transporter MFP subunit